jgi:hypothetical protein
MRLGEAALFQAFFGRVFRWIHALPCGFAALTRGRLDTICPTGSARSIPRSISSHDQAFTRYQTRLRPFIETKQRGAEQFSRAFAPKTAPGLFFRDLVVGVTRIPGLARLAVGRDIVDNLELPEH